MYYRPVKVIACLTVITALFVLTHRPFFTAPGLDPAYGGSRSLDGRAALYLGEGLRYRVHIEEQAPTPRACTMVTETRQVISLDLDPSRTGDDPAAVQDDGRRYRWLGSFRAPADTLVAIDCDDAHAPLRVHVVAPGLAVFLWLLLSWLVVLGWSVIRTVRTFVHRRESKRQSGIRPPAHTTAPVAAEALQAMHEHEGTVVLFRNGTVVRTGHQAPEKAAEQATAFLASRHHTELPSFKVAQAGDTGWLVTFPDPDPDPDPDLIPDLIPDPALDLDLATYVSKADAKDTTTQGIGRCARAKLTMDGRDPVVLEIRAPRSPSHLTPA